MSTYVRAALVFCLSTCVLSSGCSWMMVRPAAPTYNPRDADRPPECTTGQAPPILDTLDAVGAGGVAVTGAVVTAESTRRNALNPAGPALIGVGALSSILFSISAGHGYSETARCRRRRNEFQASMNDRPSPDATPDDDAPDTPDADSDDTSLADKEILTILEAAKVCSVDPATIRQGLSSGDLEAVQSDRGYEIPRAEVISYCAALDESDK